MNLTNILNKNDIEDFISDVQSNDSDDTLIDPILDKLTDFKISDNNSSIHVNGYLKIVIGCMFSGKTTYIINECKKWKRLGKRALIINYALDRRYSNDDKVISHDEIGVDCLMMHKLTFDTSINIDSYDIILVNEGQFFPNLKEKVKYLVDFLKKIVIISGLDGDYLRNSIGDILELIPDCDELIKLKAYCSLCSNGTEAIFTWKTQDNPTDKEVLIDIGTEKYIPLCRKHYNQERFKKEHNNKQINKKQNFKPNIKM